MKSLLILWFTCIASVSASNCTLCLDGSAPTTNSSVLFQYGGQNLSCSYIDNMLQSAVNASDPTCATARTGLSSPCGCPTNSTNTTAMCPGICETMAYPNRFVPPVTYNGLTLSLTCAQANGLLKTLPADNEYCVSIPLISAAFCGCSNAPPSCTPCYSNAVPDYSGSVTFEGENFTCAEWAITTAMTQAGSYNASDVGSRYACSVFQYVSSVHCGCPKVPVTCPACDSTQTLVATKTFTSGSSTSQCGLAELTVGFPTNDCKAVLAASNALTIQSQCCIKKSSSPSIFASNWVGGMLAMMSTASFLWF